MLEENVVNDCIQVYKWLRSRTDAPIYVWGHSLGTSLATSTLSKLGEEANVTGLILEASFTNFREALYHNPYVKVLMLTIWLKLIAHLFQGRFLFTICFCSSILHGYHGLKMPWQDL